MRHEPPLTDEEWELVREHFPMLQTAPASVQRVAIKRLQETAGAIVLRSAAEGLPTLEQSLTEIESVYEVLGQEENRAPSGVGDRVTIAVLGPDGTCKQLSQTA